MVQGGSRSGLQALSLFLATTLMLAAGLPREILVGGGTCRCAADDASCASACCNAESLPSCCSDREREEGPTVAAGCPCGEHGPLRIISGPIVLGAPPADERGATPGAGRRRRSPPAGRPPVAFLDVEVPPPRN